MSRRIVYPPKITAGRIYVDDWSMPDPNTLTGSAGPIDHARRLLFPEQNLPAVVLSHGHLRALLWAAEAYLHLTTHPAGTERAVGQLRDIRRALKTLAKESR